MVEIILTQIWYILEGSYIFIFPQIPESNPKEYKLRLIVAAKENKQMWQLLFAFRLKSFS